MTVQRGFAITIGSALVFGCLGALMGWALRTFTPDYYRWTLGISTDVQMDLSQVGIGLGVTQGLALGIVVGLKENCFRSLNEVASSRNGPGRIFPSCPLNSAVRCPESMPSQPACILASHPANLRLPMPTLPFSLSDTKALIFDMDGTVTDNIPYHEQSWIAWAKREGLALSEAELLTQTYGTIGEITRRLFPDATPQHRFELGERKEALYREIYKPHLTALPGLEEFLIWARRQKLPLAIATAGDAKNIGFTIDGLKLRSYFDAFIGSEEVTHGKPDPEVYLIAAQKLRVAAEQCVAFEDSVAGTEAARRAGMKCIVVNQMAPRDEFGDCSHVLAWINDYRAFSTFTQS